MSCLSYLAEETWPTLCLKGRQANFGVSSLGTNKDQLLHRIQSVRTFTNLQYFWECFFGIPLCFLNMCHFFRNFSSILPIVLIIEHWRRNRECKGCFFNQIDLQLTSDMVSISSCNSQQHFFRRDLIITAWFGIRETATTTTQQ